MTNAQGNSYAVAASWTANPIAPTLSECLGADSLRFLEANQIFQICLDPSGHGLTAGSEVIVLWRLEDVFEKDLLASLEGSSDATERLLDGCRELGTVVSGLIETHAMSATVSTTTLPVGFGIDHSTRPPFGTF